MRWTKGQSASGKWNDTVVDYKPLMKMHWILYDVPDENGDAYFPQNLISNGASHNWGFLPTSQPASKLQTGGGGVMNLHLKDRDSTDQIKDKGRDEDKHNH